MTIRLETMIRADVSTVFDLARDIDFHQQSAHGTQETAIAGRTSGLAEFGDQITWRARHFGIWQKLTVEITEMESPYRFVDEMRSGAFRSMSHEHLFVAVDGGTLMTDVFTFVAPLGPLGWLAERLFLRRYMTRFIQTRNELLCTEAESRG